jgi:hypothetical protein
LIIFLTAASRFSLLFILWHLIGASQIRHFGGGFGLGNNLKNFGF